MRRLAWRVRTFGFHLARLDVRQESSVHARAVAAALGDADWEQRGAVERAALLGPYASGDAVLPASAEEGNERLDAVFKALAAARMAHQMAQQPDEQNVARSVEQQRLATAGLVHFGVQCLAVRG